jgi:hypothetical protein
VIPSSPLGQPSTGQHPAGVVDNLDVVMILGPVTSHEQHRLRTIGLHTLGSAEETASDLIVECSPTQAGDVIPAAVSLPHDQRAHSLPQDLKDQSGKC